MINARELLPMSWIANEKGFYAMVMTNVPRYGRSPETAHLFEWLINGEDEGAWSGIPLTQEMLRRNKWDLKKDDKWFEIYGLPNGVAVAWISHNDCPLGPKGTILFSPDDRPIQFVHQLQLQYFSATSKHLNFDL